MDALTSTSPQSNLIALVAGQADELGKTAENATVVFKENQKQQQLTIETLTKANADLAAKLLASEAELAKYKSAEVAAKVALKEKKEASIEKAILHLKQLSQTCSDAKLLLDDLQNLEKINFGKDQLVERNQTGWFTMLGNGDFPGGQVEDFIAHYTAKLKASHGLLNGNITGNFVAENKRNIQAIENEAKKIFDELK